MGHFPHGSSIRQLTHYGQCIANKQLQLYDYHDKEKNQEKYGQDTPPNVDLQGLSKVPIAMFSGKFDRVVNVDDNLEFASQIPTVVKSEALNFDHLSFLIGKDMSYMLEVLNLLQEHNPLNYDIDEVMKKSVVDSFDGETLFYKYVDTLSYTQKQDLLSRISDLENDPKMQKSLEVFKRALAESKDKTKYEKKYPSDFDDDEYDFSIIDQDMIWHKGMKEMSNMKDK